MKLILTVKGSPAVAGLAAQQRRIPYIVYDCNERETKLKVDKRHEEAVARWFIEPEETPYQEGTLLFYTDQRGPEQ